MAYDRLHCSVVLNDGTLWARNRDHNWLDHDRCILGAVDVSDRRRYRRSWLYTSRKLIDRRLLRASGQIAGAGRLRYGSHTWHDVRQPDWRLGDRCVRLANGFFRGWLARRIDCRCV